MDARNHRNILSISVHRTRTAGIWHKSLISTVKRNGKKEHYSCTSKWDWCDDPWNGSWKTPFQVLSYVIVFKMVMKQRALCKSFPNPHTGKCEGSRNPLQTWKAAMRECSLHLYSKFQSEVGSLFRNEVFNWNMPDKSNFCKALIHL